MPVLCVKIFVVSNAIFDVFAGNEYPIIVYI